MRIPVFLYILSWLALGGAVTASAQDSVSYSPKKASSVSKMRKAADELKESLSSDDEEQTARQYETLSRELSAKGDYARAEEYMKKALDIYTRLNKKKEMAATSRAVARAQESQKKIGPAITNYKNAAEVALDKNTEQANYNDVNRLRNQDNPKAQLGYAQHNADLFEKQGKKEEAADAYQQLAETQLQQSNPGDAVKSYEKAIKVSGEEGNSKLHQEIIKAYVADHQIDKAIALSEDLLRTSKVEHNTDRQTVQLLELGNLYQQANNNTRAEAFLKEAYQLALNSKNTIQAKISVEALSGFYEKQGNNQASLAVHRDFLLHLDSLISTDSALIDARIFEVTEGRIRELEQEKILQNELMAKTTRFNYVLIGSVLLMLLLLFFIARALYAIRIKNKKIALQSLRREMNPHFIFNSLNSVNQYIAENNELEANKYLTSYSGLMRNIMENSNKDFVSLRVETDQLKKYLELEHQRFHDKFDFNLVIDEQLDADAVLIPNMLIQPHLENAIWHGLRYKEGKGTLRLECIKKGSGIEVIVLDNGIGLTRSRALKTLNQKAHQSRGISNTEERISLLNDIYKTHITLRMEEVHEDGATGTRVRIQVPLITAK